MAVAMEPASRSASRSRAWRGSELPVVLDATKKSKSRTACPTAWGADAQKLMHMMMGQLHSSAPPSAEVAVASQLSTLDLFGNNADPTRAASQLDLPSSTSSSSSAAPEFLELEPEQTLPSGWEKCLDLKSGKLFYVQKSSGVSTVTDPRNLKWSANSDTELQTHHEFLGSKRSETLRQENSLKASSSSSSGTPRLTRKQQHSSSLDLFRKQQWDLQLVDDRHVATTNRCGEEQVEEERLEGLVEEDSNLELDLNLAAGGSVSPKPQTVCTMEMIQNALRRTATQQCLKQSLSTTPVVVNKGEIPSLQDKLSVSSSFSSLTSMDPIDSCVAQASPSTSSSSSTSSRSRRRASKLDDSRQSTFKSRGCEGDSNVDSGALVMGACTRCLMYVMLKKLDPKCPRCESEVPLDFSGPPCKRQRLPGSERTQ